MLKIDFRVFIREVIFVQPISYNSCDNHFSLLLIRQKQWREKEEERE